MHLVLFWFVWFGLVCGAVVLGVDFAVFFFLCPGGTCLEASLRYVLRRDGRMEELAVCSLPFQKRAICPSGFESCIGDGMSQKVLFCYQAPPKAART